MQAGGRISEQYLAEQRRLHQNPNYGVASTLFAPLVRQIMEISRARSLADYGAGKCRLAEALREAGLQFDYRPYDPAFPEYGPPRPAEVVACIDVLEHVEPEHLDGVLEDLRAITQRLGFFTVHTGAAVKVLADGRNAHLIQKPPSWWLPRFCERFEIEQMQRNESGFWVIVSARRPWSPTP